MNGLDLAKADPRKYIALDPCQQVQSFLHASPHAFVPRLPHQTLLNLRVPLWCSQRNFLFGLDHFVYFCVYLLSPNTDRWCWSYKYLNLDDITERSLRPGLTISSDHHHPHIHHVHYRLPCPCSSSILGSAPSCKHQYPVPTQASR